MSTRARKAEKSELQKYVKSIDNRMTDFETAVEDLKALKESIPDMDDAIVEKIASNNRKLEELSKSFADNKIRMVNEAVADLNKVVITKEELASLRDAVDTVREECADTIATQVSDHKVHIEELRDQALKVQSLEFDCKTAQLNAQVATYRSEVSNLKETLTRMSNELESQKLLTAQVVGAGKSHTPANPSN
jgi:multidrug resistance efflux pump